MSAGTVLNEVDRLIQLAREAENAKLAACSSGNNWERFHEVEGRFQQAYNLFLRSVVGQK